MKGIKRFLFLPTTHYSSLGTCSANFDKSLRKLTNKCWVPRFSLRSPGKSVVVLDLLKKPRKRKKQKQN